VHYPYQGRFRSRTARFALAHEIGHIYDTQTLTDENRARLTGLMGFPADTVWDDQRDAESCWKRCPLEMFADAYAACAIGATPGVHRIPGRGRVYDWQTTYGYEPSQGTHREVCAVIRATRPAQPDTSEWRTSGR
jgi:hypothetical protein